MARIELFNFQCDDLKFILEGIFRVRVGLLLWSEKVMLQYEDWVILGFKDEEI